MKHSWWERVISQPFLNPFSPFLNPFSTILQFANTYFWRNFCLKMNFLFTNGWERVDETYHLNALISIGQALLLSKGHFWTLPQPFLTLPQPLLNPYSTLTHFLDFIHSAALLWWILEIFIPYAREFSLIKSSSQMSYIFWSLQNSRKEFYS